MIPRFKKSRFEPKPIETDYWIDLNENEYGGVFKYYDNNAMVWKQTESITREKEPQFTSSAAYKITTNDIDYWNAKVGIEDFDALKEEILDLGSQFEGVTIETLEYYNDTLRADFNDLVYGKADKSTTLNGYGIRDAYTKEQVDTKFNEWKVELPENVSYFKNDVGYVTESNLESKLPNNIVSDENYIHTDNNFTNEYKNKVDTNSQELSNIKQQVSTNQTQIKQLQSEINTSISDTVQAMSQEIAKKANADEVYTKTYLDEVFKQFVKKSYETSGFVDDRPTEYLTSSDTGFVFYDFTVNEPLIWVADSWRLFRTNKILENFILDEDINIPSSSIGNWDTETINESFTRLMRYTGGYTNTLDLQIPNMYNGSFVLDLNETGNTNDYTQVVYLNCDSYYSISGPVGDTSRPALRLSTTTITSKKEAMKGVAVSDLIYLNESAVNVLGDVFPKKDATTLTGTYTDVYYDTVNPVSVINSISLPKGIKNINNFAFCKIATQDTIDFQIPDGVNYIGDDAFKYNNIRSVQFPRNPIKFGSHTFAYCKLEEVHFPTTLDWEDIKKGGAAGLFSMQTTTQPITVTFNEGVRAIPQACFYKTKVSKIEFPKSLEFIGYAAFYDSNVSGEFDSANINTIESFAFRNANFTKIVLQPNVKYIAPNAFQYSGTNPCTALILSPNLEEVYQGSIPGSLRNCYSDIVTPPKLKKIPLGAFTYYGYNNNNGIESNPDAIKQQINLVISEGTECIDSHAFQYAFFTNNELILPDSLKYINSSAFSQAHKFKCEKIRLGKNVRVIGGKYTTTGPGNEILYTALQNGDTSKILPLSKNGYSLVTNYYEYLEDGGKVYPNSFEPFYSFCVQTLKAFEVDEENQWFKAVDGVLFSKDGKRLVRYPSGKGIERYEVPEGCVYFDSSSFYNSGISETYLSESGYAHQFLGYRGNYLKEIVLPNTYVNYTPEEMLEMFGPATVNLASNNLVQACTYFAWIEKITVKDDHPLYKNDGVWLLSKDGTTLQCLLPGLTGEHRIPDSVTTIAQGAVCKPNGMGWRNYDYDALYVKSNFDHFSDGFFRNLKLTIPNTLVNMDDIARYTFNHLHGRFGNEFILEEGNPAFVQDPLTGKIMKR